VVDGPLEAAYGGGFSVGAGEMRAIPESRYAQSGDLSIAYQEVGAGPALLWIPGFASHVELQWELPCFGGFMERLARFSRLIVFDKRGMGLSDRNLGAGALEDRMDDIRAVLDACGVERAALVGISEGGPLAVLFSATYPERVSQLVLYASYAFGGGPGARRDVMCQAIAARWGTGMIADAFVAGCDERARELIGRFERFACTPARAVEKMRLDSEIDVRPVLGAVRAPTLVLHNQHDPVIRVSGGREMAAGIPAAILVELSGDFHAHWDPSRYDPIVAEIEEFVTGHVGPADDDVDRVLATVLFSDIVDSTGLAAELGDRRWRQLLDEHDNLVRQELERFRGREVNTTGDGFVATFDGPGRAIRCGHSIIAAIQPLGVRLRVGIHTGECERRGDDFAGVAIHIGARVAGLARPGEVLVTRTVRDLVSGSGVEFSPRGEHALKGVPGTWQLLASR
jgi:class 3 adenylate cyclase